jgi:hypothetical protein
VEPANLDPPERDDKDWTWTLTRRCDDCGLSAGEIPPQELAGRLYVAAEEWVQILRSSPAVDARPEPGVWSPLEYGAHVRDVFAVFGDRLRLLLAENDPAFPNWDQNEAAIEGRYGEQDPEAVADDLEASAQLVAGQIAALTPDQLDRTGRRSNGSAFTVLTLLQYFLHDIVHHLWDVTGQQDGVESLALE